MPNTDGNGKTRLDRLEENVSTIQETIADQPKMRDFERVEMSVSSLVEKFDEHLEVRAQQREEYAGKQAEQDGKITAVEVMAETACKTAASAVGDAADAKRTSLRILLLILSLLLASGGGSIALSKIKFTEVLRVLGL